MPDSLTDGDSINTLFRDWKEIGIVWIIVILFLAWLAVTVVQYSAQWLTRRLPSRYRFYILPWVPVIRLLIIILAVVEIVPLVIKPTTSNLIALFGAAGVAIGFAFKDYVNSLIAGIVVLYEQPYRIGDWVKIGPDYGEVRALGIRAVELVTPDDTVVTVSHTRIWDSAIHNSNAGHRDMQCIAEFHVPPLPQGEAIRRKLLDVALTSVYLHAGRPVVAVAFQQPWGTRYLIRAYPVECREQFAFATDLTLRGNAALLKMGVPLLTESPAVVANPA